MHKIAHLALAFAPFCIFLYTDISITSEHGIMAGSLKEKKKTQQQQMLTLS